MTDHTPLLSVIIPSYNHDLYVADTLKSLEEQTFQDFEIIVIDDGSSDNTVEVINTTPSRAQLHTQQNRGVVAARNRGIELARGKYICFVDSDDIVLPTRFEKQIAALEADPHLGLIYADALIIDPQGKEIGKFGNVYPVKPGPTDEMLALHYCFTPMITVTVRAETLRQTGPFTRPGPISDYMKWIEVAAISKTLYDPTPLGCWRRHPKSTSKQANKERSYALTRMALRRVLKKYPDLNRRLARKINRRLSRSYFLTAFFLAADGNTPRARKYYRKAIKTNPPTLENYAGLILTTLLPKPLARKIHNYVRTKKLPW